MTIYDGKHKRCIVCSKKAMRDGFLQESLCEACDKAIRRWDASDAVTMGDHVCAWIARRVRAHERKRVAVSVQRAFGQGLSCLFVDKGK